MLGSITPLGERGRARHWPTTVTYYVLGSLLDWARLHGVEQVVNPAPAFRCHSSPSGSWSRIQARASRQSLSTVTTETSGAGAAGGACLAPPHPASTPTSRPAARASSTGGRSIKPPQRSGCSKPATRPRPHTCA